MAIKQGPTPGQVVVACAYYTQETLQELLGQSRGSEARELTTRLQGVSWIDNIRQVLELYVFSFGRSSGPRGPLSDTIQTNPNILHRCRQVPEVQSQVSLGSTQLDSKQLYLFLSNSRLTS